MGKGALVLFLSAVLSVTIFASCKRGSLGCQDYVKWMDNPNNGFKMTKAFEGIKYTLQYKTKEYLAIQDNKGQPLSPTSLAKGIEQYNDMCYFTLRMETFDKAHDPLTVKIVSEDEYHQRNTYFSYQFQNELKVLVNTDTVNCGLFSMVNNYGLAPYVDFVLGFPLKSDKVSDDLVFLLDDKTFNNGIVKFTFKSRDINDAPKLLTN